MLTGFSMALFVLLIGAPGHAYNGGTTHAYADIDDWQIQTVHGERSALSSRPMHAGKQARPDGWNSDGAPQPPHMWRGHGGGAWPTHYKACKRRYSSYDHQDDTYHMNGRRVRCAL